MPDVGAGAVAVSGSATLCARRCERRAAAGGPAEAGAAAATVTGEAGVGGGVRVGRGQGRVGSRGDGGCGLKGDGGGDIDWVSHAFRNSKLKWYAETVSGRH